MKKKKIKIIGMDFDNTLIDHSLGKPHIDKELLEYLNNFIRNGGYAGIVSGRREYEMRLIFEIMDIPWGKPFPNFIITRESFINLIKEDNEKIAIYNEKMKNQISIKMFKLGIFAGDWAEKLEKNNFKISTWNLFGDFSLEYAMIDPSVAENAIPFLQNILEKENLDKDYYIHRNGNLLTIIDLDSGKGNVLEKFMHILKLNPEEILAIGDSLNDISMVNGIKGFIGGCVENSDETLVYVVKETGGYVGKGTASKSIMDIIKKLEIDNKI